MRFRLEKGNRVFPRREGLEKIPKGIRELSKVGADVLDWREGKDKRHLELDANIIPLSPAKDKHLCLPNFAASDPVHLTGSPTVCSSPSLSTHPGV